MRCTWEDIIEEFITHKSGTKTEKTAIFYKSRLSMVRRWAIGQDIQPEEFRLRHMEKYLRERRGKVAPNTLRHDAVAAKHFFRWSYVRGFLDADPLCKLDMPPTEERLINPPPANDLHKMLKAVKNRQENHRRNSNRKKESLFLAARDTAFLGLLIETGLRIGEAIRLTVKDVDIQQRTVTVAPGKTHYGRILPITIDLAELLDLWIRKRPHVSVDWLFVNVFGDQMKDDTVREWLHRVQQDAGVEHFNLHQLRHFACSEIVRKQGILAGRDLLGHRNISTTNRYSHIHQDRLRESVDDAATLRGILRSVPAQPKRRKIFD